MLAKKNIFLLIFFFFFTPFFCKASLPEEEKNKIIICDNGLEMFCWDLDFLSQAQQSVEILACFFGGDIAQQLLKAIDNRLQENPDLQVYMLASPMFMDAKDFKSVDTLKHNHPNRFHIAYSVQVSTFYPDLLTIDNHVKMFIVDETYFSTGGTNLEERHCSEGTYMPKNKRNETEILLPSGTRDQDIVGRGPIAKELRRIFYQLYSVWEDYSETQILKSDPVCCQRLNHYSELDAQPFVDRFEHSNSLRDVAANQIQLIFGGPHQKVNAITAKYVQLIQEAKEEIILEHLYFLPIDVILTALIDAVNRGVKITVITNGLSEISPNGANFFIWGNRMSYVPLFYGREFHFWDFNILKSTPLKSTQIFEYYVEDIFLHKKVMLIDQKTLVVGSYNLGIKSAYGDYEIILVINSKEAAQDALKVFQKDLIFSRRISPEEACHWYFDPIISCLGSIQKKFSGFM